VKEIRVLLLAFFTLIAARMMSELPSCPGGLSFICGNGLLVLIPFFLSTYFVDSLICYLSAEGVEPKTKIINGVLCIPYILITGFVVVEFLTSISVVTIEYILTLKTIYAAVVYGVLYSINNISVVKKMNTVFMVSLILSFVIFTFI